MSEVVCCLFSPYECRYVKTKERLIVEVQFYVFWLLHQLRLVYICNSALQLLWMFREELEFGAVTFRMLARVVITNLSWSKDQGKKKKINVKRIHKHSQQIKVKSDVYAVFSTMVLLPVEIGPTCPGLFVFLHATLHSLRWPWRWFLSVRRSWPGSPSLIHQPLLKRNLPLLKHRAFCDVRCAPVSHVCVVFLYVCNSVCVWDDKMPDNHFKEFIN